MSVVNTWTVGLAVALVLVIYAKVKSVYGYFRNRGVPYVEPTFLLGSNIKGALLLEHNSTSWGGMYDKLEGHKIGGFFQLLKPYYVIRDPEYINRVFISDFSHFQDRGIKTDETVNPLEGHLFLLAGQKWRYLRSKLSPIFTSGKLRWMYEEMEKCGETFKRHFQTLATGKDLDLKEDFARFTTDVIGSCAFGIDSEALKNPNSKFREIGKKVFSPTIREGGMFLLRLTIPELLLKLKVKSMADEVTDFYCSMIKQAFNHRKSTGYQRKDFVQLLLELREKGSVHIDPDDAEEVKNSTKDISTTAPNNFELTDSLLAAQSFVFLVAGFETTASTLYFATYLLSKHPEIQEKAREEVRRVKKKYGIINYDAVKDMEYLDMIFHETLRMYPPVPHLFRECTKEYTFPDGTKIEKGAVAILPMYSLHFDPKYFPEPNAFRPERFEKPPQRGTYAPFGDGPRICIGKRFALIEMKMALAQLLDEFAFEKSTKTVEPIEFSPLVFTLAAKNGVFTRVKRLAQ